MKKRIVPKTTLILLLFTLLLAWSAVLPGRADSLIKSKEFTTRTFYADGDDDEVEFTENFGFAGDSYLNSGRFRMDITLTPVYNSIWISSDGERANLATEPAIVNLINGRLNSRIDTATGGEFQPDYGSDGMIRSFRYSRSDLLSDDLTYANFTVTLPDEYAIESLFYQYGEDLEIDDVQYSVKFNVKVSIYGNAPGIKLKKKVLYGYINDIWYYFTENAGDKQGAMFCKRWAEVPYNGTVEWYYFDENGTMKTDWLTQDENKFYLYPIADGTRGRMLTGWQKIGDNWYYFHEESDGNKGVLARRTKIGNYYVNSDGVWAK